MPLLCMHPCILLDLYSLAAYSLFLQKLKLLSRIPSFRTKSCGQRSFSYQAPDIWNQLPVSVRHSTSVSSFKSSVETFLFEKQQHFFSPIALRYVCVYVCVRACVCVYVRACVRACVCVCVGVRVCVLRK